MVISAKRCPRGKDEDIVLQESIDLTLFCLGLRGVHFMWELH